MKQAGIVCDNHKLDKFEEELTFAGFMYRIKPYTEDTSAILVSVEEEKMEANLKELKKICSVVELHFKRRN